MTFLLLVFLAEILTFASSEVGVFKTLGHNIASDVCLRIFMKLLLHTSKTPGSLCGKNHDFPITRFSDRNWDIPCFP